MIHVMSGTECSIENFDWEHTPPTREDVAKAYVLIVHLKVNTDITDEESLRINMKANGGGYAKSFDLYNGPKKLRGKYRDIKRKSSLAPSIYLC